MQNRAMIGLMSCTLYDEKFLKVREPRRRVHTTGVGRTAGVRPLSELTCRRDCTRIAHAW